MEKGQPRKFPNIEALENHMDKAHHLHFCGLCLNEKPILLFEQELYKWGALNRHMDRDHHTCQHCPKLRFYDYDALYKHYREDHFLCGVCKKMGKKKRNKETGAIEYEVFRDNDSLRHHYRKKHYTCKKIDCIDLAFTDEAHLASHMLSVHNERMNINLGFKYESSDEESKLPEDYYQR